MKVDGLDSLANLGGVTNLTCTPSTSIEVRNSGVLRLAPASAIAGVNLTLRDAGELHVDAVEFAPGTIATLSGSLRADVLVSGELRPGSTTGILTIDGDYTQTETGILRLDIAGLLAGTEFDQLAVSGEVSLDGRLNVVRSPRFNFASGQSFRILSSPAVTGQFSTVSGNTQAEVALEPVYSPTAVDLQAP